MRYGVYLGSVSGGVFPRGYFRVSCQGFGCVLGVLGKDFKINFADTKKVSTFAVPNGTGVLKKGSGAAGATLAGS